jgi:nitric oxide synthase-interacting protein
MRPPHYCCLTLQPAAQPVLHTSGFLYDKQAILEYALHAKHTIKLDNDKYKALQEHKAKRDLHKGRLRLEQEVKRFEVQADRIVRGNTNCIEHDESAGSGAGFWAPHQRLAELQEEVHKPDMQVKCPMSGKPLKIALLIPCIFTPLGEDQFMCPLSRKQITHSTECVVLKSSGHVISEESLVESVLSELGRKLWSKKEKKQLKKGDERIEIGTSPFDSKPITLSDIIVIQREGTGYSGMGERTVIAKGAHAPAFLAS